MADAMDPAALAGRLSAAFRAAIKGDQDAAVMPAALVETVAIYLDSAAQMLAAAAAAHEFARDLAAARARVAELEGVLRAARASALEEAAAIANADDGTARGGNMDFGPNVARRIAARIRALAEPHS